MPHRPTYIYKILFSQQLFEADGPHKGGHDHGNQEEGAQGSPPGKFQPVQSDGQRENHKRTSQHRERGQGDGIEEDARKMALVARSPK